MHKGDVPMGLIYVGHAYPSLFLGIYLKTATIVMMSVVVIALHIGLSALLGWLVLRWQYSKK
jgi:type IV secretory pathway VirB3-like protein